MAESQWGGVSTRPWEPAGKSHLDAAFQSILHSGASDVLFCDLLDPRNAPAEKNSIPNWTRHAVDSVSLESHLVPNHILQQY